MYSSLTLEDANKLLINSSNLFSLFTETDYFTCNFSSNCEYLSDINSTSIINSNYTTVITYASRVIRCLYSNFLCGTSYLSPNIVINATIKVNISSSANYESSIRALITNLLSILLSNNHYNSIVGIDITVSSQYTSDITVNITINNSTSVLNSLFIVENEISSSGYLANNKYRVDFLECADSTQLEFENGDILRILGAFPNFYCVSNTGVSYTSKLLYSRYYKSFVDIKNILNPYPIVIIYKPVAYVGINN